MLHALVAWLPFAPGDPTTPGPQMPTATVTVTAPAPVPSPAATVPGWASTGIQQTQQFAGQAAEVGVNQGAIYGALMFGASIMLAFLAFKQFGAAPKGDVKLAGRQSAVAAIGSTWLGIALIIGAAVVLGLAVNLIRGAITF